MHQKTSRPVHEVALAGLAQRHRQDQLQQRRRADQGTDGPQRPSRGVPGRLREFEHRLPGRAVQMDFRQGAVAVTRGPEPGSLAPFLLARRQRIADRLAVGPHDDKAAIDFIPLLHQFQMAPHLGRVVVAKSGRPGHDFQVRATLGNPTLQQPLFLRSDILQLAGDDLLQHLIRMEHREHTDRAQRNERGDEQGRGYLEAQRVQERDVHASSSRAPGDAARRQLAVRFFRTDRGCAEERNQTIRGP